jgi:alanyl-tRNA synthetase
VIPRIHKLLGEIKEKDRQIESLKQKLLTGKAEDITAGIKEINGIKVVAKVLEADSQKELRDAADKIRDKIRSGIVVVGAEKDGKVMLTCMVTKDLIAKFNAGEIIKEIASLVGGKGGGRVDMAQGGGNKPEHLKTALEHVYDIVSRHSS